ncbi:MAG: hypothetical protein CMJ26_01310 [Phycisphaerae bacterium]|nr:hypothetical protein [Phycisphaerae bacterium]|tara:strand:- start:307 stop:822 length:516 start_codon:yes stop_codon:yes gene_type:complete
MARFGNTQGVSRPTGICAETGDGLVPNTQAMATLSEREEDEGFDRLDYSISAWEEGKRPKRLFSYWKYTVPDSEKKQGIMIDDAVIDDLFERLADEEQPQRIAFRYILALVLLRKRKLKLVGREDADEGEIWLLQCKGVEGEPVRVKNPGIAEEEIQDLSEQLGEILQGDF